MCSRLEHPVPKRMHAFQGDGAVRHVIRRDCPSMHMTEEVPTGWVKPVAKPTRESLKARIAELRAELAQAEEQLRQLEGDARLEALVKIRNLMRGFNLTLADLGLEPVPKRRGRPRKTAG